MYDYLEKKKRFCQSIKRANLHPMGEQEAKEQQKEHLLSHIFNSHFHHENKKKHHQTLSQ
jgi:hypothetical protein